MTRSALPLVLALAACRGEPATVTPPTGPTVTLSDGIHDPDPQAPLIFRDVAMIDDDVEYVRPYVPGHRTTMDGRVAIRVQGGTEEIDRLSTNLSFFLFAPEKLDQPIVTGPAGARILADPTPWDVVFPPALEADVYRLGHHAICDPTEEFAAAGERPNPYVCGDDALHDCYDLTIISSTSPGVGSTLWGTPVTVEVADPKTPDARIVDVALGEPVQGIDIPMNTEFTEPAVTADGRLLTGRLGRAIRSWTNPETGETMERPYDLAYALLPADAAPCDITAWTDFHPMSHAPYDPAMVGTYGLAAHPFRDTEGEPIEDGEDMGGTYPWVDREGANVFMTGVHGTLSEQSETEFPRHCANEGCDSYRENVDFDRGFMVAGLWTHGKLVHLDGLINNIDWAVGVQPQTHWMVDLYEDEDGEPVPVRLGSGRFIEHFRQENGPYPDGYTHNANVLDSLQQLPNWNPAARPVTPRDVVWVMSTGVATDEVSFDDMLDADAVIVSNMQPSITQLRAEDGATTSVPHQHNGQVRDLLGVAGLLTVYELQPNEHEPVHIQNGATTLHWEVPAYGHVETGEVRTEPVALGGIEGRGLWLSGDAGVVYTMPDQPELDGEDTTIGIFVDNRADSGETRELLRFPDKTGVLLRGDDVLYVRGDVLLHTVSLPPTDGWVHLGWRIAGGHRAVTLLHEGMALDHYTPSSPVFSLSGGDLVLGRCTASWTGFRGWVDDLVVLAHDVDPEVACNHARGTLVDVGTHAEWGAIADRYPAWAHEAVADAAGLVTTRAACVLDHSDDHAATLANLPDGTTHLRGAILFPEGPLRHGVPRPDSSDNAFCLTCHTDDGRDGMHTDALVLDPDTPAEQDLRRQPNQPPRRVFGNVPAGWIPAGEGTGSPEEAVQAPAEGLLIDAWVMPAG
jgi:hypothetical protein